MSKSLLKKHGEGGLEQQKYFKIKTDYFEGVYQK